MPNFVRTCVACHRLLERKATEGPRAFMFRRFCNQACARKIAPFNKRKAYERTDFVKSTIDIEELEQDRAKKIADDYKFDEAFG